MDLFNLVFLLLAFLKCLSIRSIILLSLRAGYSSSKAIKMSSALHIVGQVDCHSDMRNKEFRVQFLAGAQPNGASSLILGVNPFPSRFINRTVPW